MFPVWAMNLHWVEIKEAAYANGLSPLLVAALVQTESGGDPMATRYEPHFKWTSDIAEHASNCNITLVTEEIHQKTSFGCLQLMGGTARDIGFTDTLPELLDIYTGLNWGCIYLAKKLKTYKEIDKTLAAYNAGSARYKSGTTEFVNQAYVDKVKGYLKELV